MSVLYSRTNFKSDCGVYRQLIQTESSNIDDYIKQLSQFLKDKDKRINAELDEMELVETLNIPEDLAIKVGEFLTNNANKTIHNALFVMTNSFLEWAIVELCRLTAIYIDDDFFAYRNGNGLEKAKNYLKEKINLTIAGGSDWQLFTDNQSVRNLIVHNGSNIIKDYSKGPNQQPDSAMFKRNAKHFDYTSTGFIFILKMKYIKDSNITAKKFIKVSLQNVINELTLNRGVRW